MLFQRAEGATFSIARGAADPPCQLTWIAVYDNFGAADYAPC